MTQKASLHVRNVGIPLKGRTGPLKKTTVTFILTSMSKDLIMGKATSLESRLFHPLPFHGLLIDCELMPPLHSPRFQYENEV